MPQNHPRREWARAHGPRGQSRPVKQEGTSFCHSLFSPVEQGKDPPPALYDKLAHTHALDAPTSTAANEQPRSPALPQLTRHPKLYPGCGEGVLATARTPSPRSPPCPWVSHWNIFYRLETIIKTRFKIQSCFWQGVPRAARGPKINRRHMAGISPVSTPASSPAGLVRGTRRAGSRQVGSWAPTQDTGRLARCSPAFVCTLVPTPPTNRRGEGGSRWGGAPPARTAGTDPRFSGYCARPRSRRGRGHSHALRRGRQPHLAFLCSLLCPKRDTPDGGGWLKPPEGAQLCPPVGMQPDLRWGSAGAWPSGLIP